MSFIVRAGNKPENISATVRRIVSPLEPEAAIPSVQTVRQVVASSVSEQELQVILLAVFAGMTLILACLGITVYLHSPSAGGRPRSACEWRSAPVRIKF
jgi:putative ABC transport system permease protein